MKQQILDYIRIYPGCTSTGINAAVRDKASTTDWIQTRAELDEMVRAGEIEERYYRGIITFYAKDTP